jgi:acetolactate synthase-1/2/3 large subunit
MISGGGAMHLNDSIGKCRGLKYICNHHEQACAIAAEGYFRASGKMPAVIVTSGPGGTNTITGVIGQWLDSIPALYLSGQVKQETTIEFCRHLKLRQLGDQEINIVDIVKPVTKYAAFVKNPLDIKYHLDKALYLAAHGRPGPVWLDIPLDIQSAIIDEKKLAKYNREKDEISFNRRLIKKQITELLGRIQKAERPALLIGHGVRLAGAAKELRSLINKLNMPVLTAICGHDLIQSGHPLFAGRPGICGDRPGNFVAQNSDLLLCIGARLGVRQIGYSYKTFARHAYRAMVDIDRSELRKPTLDFHMSIHADASLFIKEMLSRLAGRKIAPKKNWLDWCRKKKKILPSLEQDNPGSPKYVSSYVFAGKLFEALKPNSIVVTGNGTAYTSTFQAMRLKKGVRVFANQGCAAMGYDLPAAIGAAIAEKKKQVVLITGDGSIQMNIQELQTLITCHLPVKIFVLNNKGYLAIRATQDAYFQSRYIASGASSGVICPDICRVANAYGIKTSRIYNEKGLAGKISRLLNNPSPALCEIMMDPKQTLYPKISSAVKPDGSLASRPLEDMYPFLPRDEFRKNMIIKPLPE